MCAVLVSAAQAETYYTGFQTLLGQKSLLHAPRPLSSRLVEYHCCCLCFRLQSAVDAECSCHCGSKVPLDTVKRLRANWLSPTLLACDISYC